jgi:lipoate-protein ligase A
VEWFLIVEPDGRRGSANMAVDHSLLRAAQEGVALLRLYRWSPPCLSFGRNEPARARYDPHTIRRLGLDTVRRPTGGRAVWHDAELTYAVAAPCPVFGSLAATYIEIHRVLAAALRQLGAPVELAARPTGRALTPGAGACFAAPAGGELVAGGAKLTGSAQVREGSAFLQHGSILLENGQHVVAQVSVRAGRPPAATSLGELLGRPIGFTEVAAAIADAAGRAWPGAWRHRDPPASADEGRYADPAWTWRR